MQFSFCWQINEKQLSRAIFSAGITKTKNSVKFIYSVILFALSAVNFCFYFFAQTPRTSSLILAVLSLLMGSAVLILPEIEIRSIARKKAVNEPLQVTFTDDEIIIDNENIINGYNIDFSENKEFLFFVLTKENELSEENLSEKDDFMVVFSKNKKLMVFPKTSISNENIKLISEKYSNKK